MTKAKTQTQKKKEETPAHFLPGIHRHLTDDQYNAIPAIRSSYLAKILPIPAAARQPDKENGGKFIGSAIHTLILEPSQFDQRYLVCDVGARTAKAYKTMAEESPDKIVLLQKEVELLHQLKANLLAHDQIKAILDNITDSELSLVWEDTEAGTGLLCKAKVDFITKEFSVDGIVFPKGYFWDLKSAADLGRLSAKAYEFGYHTQFAFYAYGGRATGLDPAGSGVVAAQTSEPYPTAWYIDLSEEMMALGHWEYQRRLKKEAECREWDYYPAYEGNGSGEILTLPPWAKLPEELRKKREEAA